VPRSRRFVSLGANPRAAFLAYDMGFAFGPLRRCRCRPPSRSRFRVRGFAKLWSLTPDEPRPSNESPPRIAPPGRRADTSCRSAEQGCLHFGVPASSEVEWLDEGLVWRWRVILQRLALSGAVSVALARGPHRPELRRLMLRVENLSAFGLESSPRKDAMLPACVSTYVLLQASVGEFVATDDAAAMLARRRAAKHLVFTRCWSASAAATRCCARPCPEGPQERGSLCRRALSVAHAGPDNTRRSGQPSALACAHTARSSLLSTNHLE
jgi:hypothetical protein